MLKHGYTIEEYLYNIKKFPLVSEQEEYQAALNYQKTHDKKYAERLINSHLRLVVKTCKAYRGYNFPLDEMISEGNIGLVIALDKFDPSKGYRFSTYALWWIKAYIQKYIINNWSMVKLGTTLAQKKLFFNLNKVKNSLKLINDNISDDELKAIANCLQVSSNEAKEMNFRLYKRDSSLNYKVNSFDKESDELEVFIADSRPNQEEIYTKSEISKQKHELFKAAMKCLSEREKEIITKRKLAEKPQTLEELSLLLHISKERVRQIELSSIKKMQNNIAAKLQNQDAAFN